jgi:hypothetical protein
MEGRIRFITHKENVAARTLSSLAPKLPQTIIATSPRANKSHIGGKGTPVWIKNIVDIPLIADKKPIFNPKKSNNSQY